MADVWASTQAPPLARLVLLAIADHANEEDRTAWPSIGLLSRKTGLSESTVRRYIERLRRMKEITVKGIEGAPNRYTVRAYPCQPDTPVSVTPLAVSDTPTPVIAVTGEGCHSCDTRTIKEPSEQPSERRARRKRAVQDMPEDFALTDTLRAYATDCGLDADLEFEQFKAHHESRGNQFVNWSRAFQKWCVQSFKYDARRGA